MDGRTKYIVKYQQGSMGLQLACLSVKDKRVFVKSIVKDGQSDLTAKVSPGHQLLAVGEEDVTVGMSLNDILALIAKKKRPLSIMFAADDVARKWTDLHPMASLPREASTHSSASPSPCLPSCRSHFF